MKHPESCMKIQKYMAVAAIALSSGAFSGDEEWLLPEFCG
jgi:hypothetical protein